MPILLQTPQIMINFIMALMRHTGEMQDSVGPVSAEFTFRSMTCR